jgi:hypothetical protein
MLAVLVYSCASRPTLPPFATVSLGLSLLIFCQASAKRKTSTIAAPNIEKLLDN